MVPSVVTSFIFDTGCLCTPPKCPYKTPQYEVPTPPYPQYEAAPRYNAPPQRPTATLSATIRSPTELSNATSDASSSVSPSHAIRSSVSASEVQPPSVKGAQSTTSGSIWKVCYRWRATITR